MTGEEALAIIDKEYDIGSGGGELSNLIHQVLMLRNAGFKPSNANKKAIVAALDKRPNQEPLIAALKETIAYQQKIQAQMVAQQQQQGGQNGFSIGGAPAPFNQGGVVLGGPGGSGMPLG
jgi:protein-disulfide isomerase